MFSSASKITMIGLMLMALVLGASAAKVDWNGVPKITVAGPGRSVKGNKLTICLGDKINFFWDGPHGIAETTAANWKTCSFASYTDIYTDFEGNVVFPMKEAGTKYVFDHVNGSCKKKMIIVIKPTAC